MKKLLSLLLIGVLLLAGCSEAAPEGSGGLSDIRLPQSTTAAPTEAPTEVPTEAPTTVPTQAPTTAPTEPPYPQPLDLVGKWDRSFTEVEGDKNASAPGTCTLVIEGSTQDTLTVSYTDVQFPDGNYSAKGLLPAEGELYVGCGNSRWYANVAHTGSLGQTYCLTLLEDGTVLLQNYFTIDGAPMVSYETFVRIP